MNSKTEEQRYVRLYEASLFLFSFVFILSLTLPVEKKQREVKNITMNKSILLK